MTMTRRCPERFDFKRFSIVQKESAMKVGFDGVLLGAWAHLDECQRVLDIGAGTGLISLMAAQRTEQLPDVQIDAVEIDPVAAKECQANVSDSPWSSRVTVHRVDVRTYGASLAETYDVIVCNPPFFVDSISDGDARRSVARQQCNLTHDDLFECSARLLKRSGRLSIIVPIDCYASCKQKARDHGLFCSRATTVFPNPAKPPKRILLEFSRSQCSVTTEESTCTIETAERHVYTDKFRALTSEFYLKM